MTDSVSIKIIESRNNNINSHIIFYKNIKTNIVNFMPVRFSDNIYEIIVSLASKGNEVLEIYNYQMSLPNQYLEEVTYHIKPLPSINVTDEEVEATLEFAKLMHKNQFRKNGSPYVVHPIRVSKLIGNYYIKPDYLNFLKECALLHDIIEDTSMTILELSLMYGPKLASIIHELTNDPELKQEMGKEAYLSDKLEFMSSLALIVKLCDRLDNVSDLKGTSEEFRNKTISQTIGILDHTINNRLLNVPHIRIMQDILSILLLSKVTEEQRTHIHTMKSELEKKFITDTITLKLAR